ncbi:MAG: MATE family efflux transporter [Sporolactobacillus sp.]
MVNTKYRTILGLAGPAIIDNLLQTLVGFADTLFVARIGLGAVTAVGVANTLLAVYLAVFMAIGIGASSIIAKCIGAGNLTKARAAARESSRVALFCGILFGLITLVFARSLIQLMGADPSVLDVGTRYFRIVAIPSVIIALMIHFGNILRASGDTRSPMMISIAVNLIHVGLDYLLIFGIFSFSGLGVTGAATATVIARLIGVVLLWFVIRSKPLRFSLRRSNYPEQRSLIRQIIALSLPATAERLIMRLGQVVYLGMIVRMGTEIYAANMIAENIETFAYLPGLGLSVAATILTGRFLGAGKPTTASAYGRQTVTIGVLIMSVSGLLLFLLTPFVAGWFTSEQSAQEMVTLAMRIDAFFMPPLAIGLVLAGALQGAGDTKSPMYSTAIGMWGIRVLFIYLLGIKLGMGIAGIWIAQGIDLTVKAVFLHYRFKRLFAGKFRSDRLKNE